MLTLAERSAHLWCLDLTREPRATAMLEEAHVAWLSDRERQRFRRLQLARRRQQYLLGKVFTRQVLSRYSNTAPDAWQFTENAHGKPFLAGGAGDQLSPALYFNLSHSRERFVLLVSRVAASGVDVEFCARKRRVSRLAQRYFTAAECAWLLALPAPEQQAAFYELWTLKEAYMKARGLGQALALDAFAFDLSHPGGIRFTPDRGAVLESGVQAGNWRCWRLVDPLAGAGDEDNNQYALALVLGLDSGLDPEQVMSLAAYRYDLSGADEQLPAQVLATNVPQPPN